MDRQMFLEGTLKLNAIFRQHLTELELATYYEALSSLSNDAWGYAVNHACATLVKYPKPAELREIAKAYRRPVPQVEQSPARYTREYTMDRSQICLDIIDRKIAGRQIAERLWALIDRHPRYATELDREAGEIWARA